MLHPSSFYPSGRVFPSNERRRIAKRSIFGLLDETSSFCSSIRPGFLLEYSLSQEYPKFGTISSTARKPFRKSFLIIITGIGSKRIEQTMMKEQPLEQLVATFLSDLVHANRSHHTRHAYATDLAQLCAFYHGPVQAMTAEVLRGFFSTHLHLRPATRARKQAAVARFLTWAYQHEVLDTNPMLKIERVKLDPPQPRGLEREQIERILKGIPVEYQRDRLFFRLLLETGLRVSEGLSLYVEDIDLSLDNEHLTVVGKGGKRRMVLLDDPHLVQQLRAYLKRMGYQHGPLFRAEKNGRGGSLRYQSMQERWDSYCSQAGIACTLHQLRHTHATELINGGVSLPTIRKRLGHKNLQTTLRYAEQADETADREIRTWRRRNSQRP